jgi:DnaJ-class molecular chaperone
MVGSIVKDCQACHGAAVVRVRFVDNKHGKIRTIPCPDCKGRGSWISGQHPR